MLLEKILADSPNDGPLHVVPSLDSSTSPKPSDAYIMQGATRERRVATYHLILAPTHACNLRCQHCYLPDHAAQTIPKGTALRLLHEWDEIAGDETPGRRGIFHVKGGEPLVYKPLSAMLQAMHSLSHLHFMMTTNGTLFSRSHWQTLASLNEASDGAVTVIVSLDGASAATHQLLRGPDSFEPTMQALHGLRERGIRTYINSVLHADNVHEIDSVIDLALNLRIAQLNFLPFVPKGFGQDMRKRQLPHRLAYEKLRESYLRLSKCHRSLLAGSLPDIVTGESNGSFTAAHECVAAYRGLLYVKPDGHAYTCPNLEAKDYSVGSVHSASLRSILDGLPELYKNLHSDGKSDRYICMGERKLYEQMRSEATQLTNLRVLQADLSDNKKRVDEMSSFCVSRNW